MAKTSAAYESPSAHLAHGAVTQTLALLQPWIDYVPQQQRRLGLFICLALAIHISAFFFLTIDNSIAEMRRQARPFVSVDYPQALAVDGQPASQFWDELTDPRDFLLPINPPANATADSPSIVTSPPLGSGSLPDPALPETLHAAASTTSPLQERVAESLTPPREPFVYEATPPAVAAKTTWQWDDTLAARHPAGVPELPSPVSDTDLGPTKLRVAIDATGAVEYVFIDRSSGEEFGASAAKELDQQAALAARKIRFDPVEKPARQWGRLTVFWKYAAKPREEVLPTPPTTGQ